MGRTTHACVALLVLVVPLDARAADADASANGDNAGPVERLSLEELMNVRVRSPTRTSEAVATAPSVVSVITAEQIRLLGLRTLADALELMPGVSIVTTASGAQRVAIRGEADPDEVLFVLDDERLNDFYDGTYILEMPIENVERVELIRGPGSALYGTNASAGVVSIYSKDGNHDLWGGVGGEMTFDHSVGGGGRAHLKLARSWRRWTLRLFGSYWDTTGPRVLVTRDNADPSYSHVPGETDGATRIGMAQFLLRRDSLLTAGDWIELWSLFLYRNRDPDFGPNDVFATKGHFERSAFYLRLAYHAPLPKGVAIEHRFHFDRRWDDNLIQDQPAGFFHEVDGNFTREPGEVFPNGQFRSFAYTTYRLAESGQIEWKVQHPRGIVDNDLIVGGLLEYDWLPRFAYGQNFCCGEAFVYAGPTLANYDQLPLTQQHKDRFNSAMFVHNQLQPWKWLWITVGLRFDWFSDFGTTWNPRVALVARPHPKISLKLLYGRAFRAPSFRELYDQTGVSETTSGLRIQGNPSLQPEMTDTAEIGFETTPWHLLTLRANGFYIRTSNEIDVDNTFTFSGARFINIPGVQGWGGEAEAQLHFDDTNYLSANLSYFRRNEVGEGLPGFETDAERRFIDTRLNDLPALRINAIAVTTPLQRLHLPDPLARLVFGLSYRYISATANNNRFTFEALTVFRQPEYHELRINVLSPMWGDHLDINATIELAFNRTIAVPLTNGFYDLPTNFATLFIGLRLRQ
jgi:outer membrane receptor protein involved in Fe transport